MRVRINHHFTNLDDEPLMQGDIRWTMGEALKAALLAEPPPGRMYSAAEHVLRLSLARQIRTMEHDNRAGFDEPMFIEIPDFLIEPLKLNVMISFGPLIAGQVLPALDIQARPAGQAAAQTGAQQGTIARSVLAEPQTYEELGEAGRPSDRPRLRRT
jgi:hypothetical protein